MNQEKLYGSPLLNETDKERTNFENNSFQMQDHEGISMMPDKQNNNIQKQEDPHYSFKDTKVLHSDKLAVPNDKTGGNLKVSVGEVVNDSDENDKTKNVI